MERICPEVNPLSFVYNFDRNGTPFTLCHNWMTDCPTPSSTTTCKVPTLVYLKPEKVRLTGGASPYRLLQGVTQPLWDARSRILCYTTSQASVTIYDALVKTVVLFIPSQKKPWPLINPNHIADQNWKTRHHATIKYVTITAVLFASPDAIWYVMHCDVQCSQYATHKKLKKSKTRKSAKNVRITKTHTIYPKSRWKIIFESKGRR